MNARFAGVLSLLIASGAALGDEIKWAKDWDAAKKAAAESKKLIMVDFYTDW